MAIANAEAAELLLLLGGGNGGSVHVVVSG